MTTIRFPWHVKVDGTYYKPGELIEVANAEEYVSQGAEIVSENKWEPKDDYAAPAPSRRGRRRRLD